MTKTPPEPFDPDTDTVETAFEKWIKAGEFIGGEYTGTERLRLWSAFRSGWDTGQLRCMAKMKNNSSLDE